MKGIEQRIPVLRVEALAALLGEEDGTEDAVGSRWCHCDRTRSSELMGNK